MGFFFFWPFVYEYFIYYVGHKNTENVREKENARVGNIPVQCHPMIAIKTKTLIAPSLPDLVNSFSFVNSGDKATAVGAMALFADSRMLTYRQARRKRRAANR